MAETAGNERRKVEPYVVQGSTLYVRLPQLTRDDAAFDKACRSLLKADGPVYTVDMSAVKTITSTFIGIVAVTYLDANSQGKRMLVKAPKRVLDVFRLAGFDGKVEMEEVPHVPAQ
ncbi:MAG TPA: anti-sigma factor antagonist [Planctomycetes bacterium]|nr:anti-sigma factor antagonist [Planctomycetota bacterium]